MRQKISRITADKISPAIDLGGNYELDTHRKKKDLKK